MPYKLSTRLAVVRFWGMTICLGILILLPMLAEVCKVCGVDLR